MKPSFLIAIGSDIVKQPQWLEKKSKIILTKSKRKQNEKKRKKNSTKYSTSKKAIDVMMKKK